MKSIAEKSLVFIAAGIGFAPIKALMESLRNEQPNFLMLLCGFQAYVLHSPW